MSDDDKKMNKTRHNKHGQWTTVVIMALMIGALTILGSKVLLPETPERVRVRESDDKQLVDEQNSALQSLDKLHLVTRLPDVYSSTTISGSGVVGDFVGDRAFWLTQPDGLRKTLVVLDNQSQRNRIKKGESVHISGQVFQTGGLNEAGMRDLGAQTKATLAKERAFIYSRELVSRGVDVSDPEIALTKAEAESR